MEPLQAAISSPKTHVLLYTCLLLVNAAVMVSASPSHHQHHQHHQQECSHMQAIQNCNKTRMSRAAMHAGDTPSIQQLVSISVQNFEKAERNFRCAYRDNFDRASSDALVAAYAANISAHIAAADKVHPLILLLVDLHDYLVHYTQLHVPAVQDNALRLGHLCDLVYRMQQIKADAEEADICRKPAATNRIRSTAREWPKPENYTSVRTTDIVLFNLYRMLYERMDALFKSVSVERCAAVPNIKLPKRVRRPRSRAELADYAQVLVSHAKTWDLLIMSRSGCNTTRLDEVAASSKARRFYKRIANLTIATNLHNFYRVYQKFAHFLHTRDYFEHRMVRDIAKSVNATLNALKPAGMARPQRWGTGGMGLRKDDQLSVAVVYQIFKMLNAKLDMRLNAQPKTVTTAATTTGTKCRVKTTKWHKKRPHHKSKPPKKFATQ